MIGPSPIHEDPLDQVRFAVDAPSAEIVIADGTDDATVLLDRILGGKATGTELIIGVRGRPSRLLLEVLTSGLWPKVNQVGWVRGTEFGGFRLQAAVSVLPDLGSVRFVFPLWDHRSRSFLLGQLLKPRRYALGLTTRWMMSVYAALVRLLPRVLSLHRGVYYLWVKT